MNYFKKLLKVINALDEKELNIEFGGTISGNIYKQEFIDLADNKLYEVLITKEDLKKNNDMLKSIILYKIKNEKITT